MTERTDGGDPRGGEPSDHTRQSGEPSDPAVAARRLVTELLGDGATGVVEELFADPEQVSIRPIDSRELDTLDALRDYFGRQSDRHSGQPRVERVVCDGDTAVVRWRPAGGNSEGSASMTEVTVGDDGITSLAGELTPTTDAPEPGRPGAAVAPGVGDCVIVLSDDDIVTEVNDAALEAFDRARTDVLGESVGALLGPSPEFETDEEYLVTGPFGHREFEVRVFGTGAGGTDTARTLVARDVTQRRRRQQQLSVLNRVLRHNLRNNLDVVRSRVDYARRAGDGDVAETLAAAQEATDDLLATAGAARRVQSLLEDPNWQSVDLQTVAEDAVGRAREEYPDATVRVESGTDATATEVIEGFDRAVWELVENACEHAGAEPTVVVSVERVGQFLRLRVIDDGPGLPDNERMVLNRAVETSLEHGSGLGLWLTKWLVDASGGAVTFAVDDGTTARVDLFDGDRMDAEAFPDHRTEVRSSTRS